jgi:glycine/D-amino acid oxidase-like deaminating enzyme
MKLESWARGLWDATAAPPAPSAVLRESLSADVAVVGAGFTGLSAALHLAAQGAKVAVLEAEDVGFGGSGRNVGLVNAGLWIKPSDIERILGPVYGERLLQNLGSAPSLVFDLIQQHGIDCEASRRGTLHCAWGERGMRDMTERARQWLARSAPVQLLDEDETRALVGSSAFCGALLDRRAGTVQPLSYARGLARAAQAAGALIFTASPVQSVTDTGGAWRLCTPSGAVRAPGVIVTTNTYSKLAFNRVAAEQVRLPYFNFATRPLTASELREVLPQRQGIWDSNRILSSARLDRAGRLIFGSIGALAGGGARIHHDWSRRAMARLFPHLQGVEFEHAWFGWIGTTKDAVPRFHRLERNTYSIGGYNGRGIAPGTRFGFELAQLLSGKMSIDEMSLPLTELGAAPLRSLREMYYQTGASAAHMLSARLPKRN